MTYKEALGSAKHRLMIMALNKKNIKDHHQ